jgi:hypothetical protein
VSVRARATKGAKPQGRVESTMVTGTTHRLLFVHASAAIALSAAAACSEAGVPASPFPPPYYRVDVNAAFDASPDVGPEMLEAGCPQDLPATCPSLVPSWMNDVEPIINLRCGACHGVGGVEQSKLDFSTYQGVHNSFTPILITVAGCVMPPPGVAPLTAAERQMLLAWLVCAAPNN